jgi:hypothetical protein
MFDDMLFRKVTGEEMHWNENPTGAGYFAVEEINFSPDLRTTDRNRMQAQGIWPQYTYVGKMAIHIDGHILADSPAQLNTYKQHLMYMLMPLQFENLPDRRLGWFYIKYTGIDEYYFTEVGLESPVDIMNQALFPSVVPCQISLKSFLPYMYGVNSGRRVWVA